MRVRRYLLATGLIAAVALAGCSSPSASTDSAAGTTTGGKTTEQRDADQAKDQPARAPDLSVGQRSIVYTGSITVRVENVDTAAAQVSGYATGAGGFVGGDERHSSDSSTGTDNASITLRVPAERFAAVVQQVASLGDEKDRQTNTQDVTEETVDLDARIAVQQARVDTGRRLLGQAKSLSDLVMLEKEVATREADLASLQAKKRKLADLTALSTITAVLLGPAAVVADAAGAPGFLSGLSDGWHALVASLGVLLTVLGALLPWLLALGIPATGLIYLLRRRNRPRQPMVAALAPAGSGGAAGPPESRPPAQP